MKRIGLLCLPLLVVVAFGCGGQQGAGSDPAPTQHVLASGMEVVMPGKTSTIEVEGVDRPGKLTAALYWPSSEARVSAYFENGSPEHQGWARTRGPLKSTVEVTDADLKSGSGWRLNMENGSCCQLVTVRYSVKFEPY
jgi:hypothetical protein